MINKNEEIGGTHYSDMAIEPIELIDAFNLDFIQGCIVKYISRYKSKGGIEDLRKAEHYCKIGMKRFDRTSNIFYSNTKNKLLLKMYCIINRIDDLENSIIMNAISGEYEKCTVGIGKLISKTEEEC